MNTYTVKQFQDDFDNMLTRVENGEHIGIIDDNGKTAVMIPADDDLFKMYIEMNNEAS